MGENGMGGRSPKNERKKKKERENKKIHEKTAAVKGQEPLDSQDLSERGRLGLFRRSLRERAGQKPQAPEAESPGQPERGGDAELSRDRGAGEHAERGRHADRDAEDRHCCRSALGLDVVGDGSEGGRDDRASALHKPSENQHADLNSTREPVRDSAKKRSETEDDRAQNQDRPPADVVGEPAEGDLKKAHRETIGAEGKARQESRRSELQAVQREYRQHQEEPEHPQTYGGRKSQEDFFLFGCERETQAGGHKEREGRRA